ncbi:MAG: hypothetical protein OEO79_04495 [Gemmatimonadota bacterium]|nr:hypothetical protein [Gemmatimonadota bacterium]MDH3423843.1 hypothetical protein [Gemmatimonadota bacterium]
MTRQPALSILVVALLYGCAPEQESSSNFVAVGDMRELMAHIVDPAAGVYWDAVGTIVDAEGVHEMYPTTDEEWEAVSNAAFMIAESGNLMMMEGRARDQGAWMTMSRQLIEVSQRALEAADARNLDAVFDMGAEVYYVCTNCHAAYAIETLRPTDSRTN